MANYYVLSFNRTGWQEGLDAQTLIDAYNIGYAMYKGSQRYVVLGSYKQGIVLIFHSDNKPSDEIINRTVTYWSNRRKINNV